MDKKATRESFGEALAELGKEYNDIVVLDADLYSSTKTDEFKKLFPNRFFNLGIAEADMIGTAAGLASAGKIPFASSFAAFVTGRVYDQIRASIAYPKLNVKICGTHAGITVGEDGATHQMIEDINLMRGLPNMLVMSTSDDIQTKWAVKEISKYKGPVYLRLSRYKVEDIYDEKAKFEIGKAIQIGDGTDASIIATGITVNEAIKAKEELKEKGINVRVIDMHTIKPIDKDMIIKCAKETERIITVEDHNVIGGLGSSVCEVLVENYPKKVTRMGIEDIFGRSGKAEDLIKYYGIDKDSIIEEIVGIKR